MVIGNGLLSRVFFEYKENTDLLIFASGVSNSQESSVSEFEREKLMLLEVLENHSNKTLVYFSTCAFYDTYFKENLYLRHKRQMEKLIRVNFNKFHILRIPQIIGSKNVNQLLGFLNNKIKREEKFVLYDIERNLIDFEFLQTVSKYIFSKKCYLNKTSNIFYPANINVRDIVLIFEKIHNVKSNYVIEKKKGSLIIEKTIGDATISKLFAPSSDYYEKKLKEYYG